MKKFFCPTDFSEQADHAAEAGSYLAKKFDAELDLLHVVESDKEMEYNVGEAFSNGQVDDVFFLELLKAAEEKMGKLVNTPALSGIKVASRIKIGKPAKIIRDDIKSRQFDLVVMGTKGTSGFQEMLIGSNTEKVVRYSPVPVLAVKEHVKETNFNDIVYASSFQNEEERFVNQILKIQKAFNSTIHLVRINTPNNFQRDWTTMKVMKKFVEKLNIENYTFNIFNDTIEEDGIIYFAEEIEAGMIAMATHGRTGFAHLLSGSIAEDVVNHSKRPVLTFNMKN